MKYKLYTDVELLKDIPKFGLISGDIVKIVDYAEMNYVIEAYNVLGETLGVFILPENQIRNLKKNTVFHSRNIEFVD